MKVLGIVITCFLLWTFVSSQKHGRDPDACKTPISTEKPKKRPVIPRQFETHIEVQVLDKGKTTDLHEYYDGVNMLGRIDQYDKGELMNAYYDYKIDQLISYFPNTSNCLVTNISSTSFNYIFGTDSGGHLTMFSAAAALHFSDQGINEVYIGSTAIRGINVDIWKSCQYWADMDATMSVTWYFNFLTTSNDPAADWNTASLKQVPVRAVIQGRRYDSLTSYHNFTHYYEFFQFKSSISDPTVFETPPRVRCVGRKKTRPVPQLPNSFYFTEETIDMSNGIISFMKEYFDLDDNLVRFEYTPSPLRPNRFGSTPLIEVHDFNTGVAYVTDKRKGNCTAMGIERNTFDIHIVDPNHVRIRTAYEFFYLDKADFTYEGVRKVRGIDCDVWVGLRDDWPANINTHSIWELSFARSDWTDTNAQNQQTVTPIQMSVSIPALGLLYYYNIFDWHPRKPDVTQFDISPCFINKPRRIFQFKLPGQYKSTADLNLPKFTGAVLNAITRTSQLRAIRISKLQVMFDQDIVVMFQMMNVAPNVSDVLARKWEVPLAAAASAFTNAVNNGIFAVQLDSTFGSTSTIIAIPNSAIEVTYSPGQKSTTSGMTAKNPTTTGYGPGPMAAVGVTMPIAGFGIGAMVAYFFFK